MTAKRVRPMALGIAVLAGAAAGEPAKIPTFAAPDVSQAPPRRVVRVVDGSTIVIERDGREHTVRLIGVDTSDAARPAAPGRPYAKEASRFTTNLLAGEHVHVLLDPLRGRRDEAGRVPGYVYRAPDKLFVNAEIIRQGYGRADAASPHPHAGRFEMLQRHARAARKGLWGSAPAGPTTRPVPPADMVTITAVNKGPHELALSLTRGGGAGKVEHDIRPGATLSFRLPKGRYMYSWGSSAGARTEAPATAKGVGIGLIDRPGTWTFTLERSPRGVLKWTRTVAPAKSPRDPSRPQPVHIVAPVPFGLAVPQVNAPGVAAPKVVMVFITRTGRKYHRSGCRHLAASKIPMKLSQAKRRYKPCSVCAPPK